MPKPRCTVAYILKVFPRLSETFILNEILELERQGVRVEIFSLKRPNDPRFHAEVAQLKAEIHYVPAPESSQLWKKLQQDQDLAMPSSPRLSRAFKHCLGRAPHGLRPMLQALWITAMASRLEVDHFHAHFATLATEVAMLANYLSGIDFSFTAHAKDIFHQNADRELITQALRSARFTITVTDDNVRRLLQIARLDSHRIRRLYNGIPLSGVKPFPANSTQSNSILAVGRLVPKKGFPYLLDACQWLKSKGHHFNCRIVGRGPEKAALLRRRSELGLEDCVSLEGAQCHSTVLKWMAESNLLVLPCIVADDGDQDALPTVLLEAMALSRPVVSTDLPGVTEIVDNGRTGFVVPQRNGSSLGQAIAALLSDPSRRLAMGREARKRVEELFDLSKNVGQLADLYRETVASNPKTVKAGGEQACESRTSVPTPVFRS